MCGLWCDKPFAVVFVVISLSPCPAVSLQCKLCIVSWYAISSGECLFTQAYSASITRHSLPRLVPWALSNLNCAIHLLLDLSSCLKLFQMGKESQSAYERIFVRTPLIESVPLRPFAAGRKVFLKLENCQPSGSFKLRGVSELCKHVRGWGWGEDIFLVFSASFLIFGSRLVTRGIRRWSARRVAMPVLLRPSPQCN